MSSSSTTSKPDFQITCQNVGVEYELSRYRATTLKDAVIRSFKGKPKAEVHRALKGIDLSVRRGEFLAILGHNGSGKSTLLKVIAGILPPTQGTVQTRGVCVPLIELGAGFDMELTGRENIYLNLGLLGLTKREIANRIPEIEEFSELGEFLDMPIKTYSSGMHMRLGFACSVCINADVLLIDEILAVGDENFQKKCLQRMNEIRATGTTMILVSHDAGYAQQMADRVIVLDSGLKLFDGGPTQGARFYHELMAKKFEESKHHTIRQEEARQRKLHQNDANLQPGQVARLRKALLCNKNGGLISLPNETGILSIEFEVLEDLKQNPCIGFAIHTNDGKNIRLFGGNSRLLGAHGGPEGYHKPGVYIAKFALKSLELAAGQYRLITAIHDFSLEQTLDINTNALEFEIGSVEDPNNFDKDIISVHSLFSGAEVTSQFVH